MEERKAGEPSEKRLSISASNLDHTFPLSVKYEQRRGLERGDRVVVFVFGAPAVGKDTLIDTLLPKLGLGKESKFSLGRLLREGTIVSQSTTVEQLMNYNNKQVLELFSPNFRELFIATHAMLKAKLPDCPPVATLARDTLIKLKTRNPIDPVLATTMTTKAINRTLSPDSSQKILFIPGIKSEEDLFCYFESNKEVDVKGAGGIHYLFLHLNLDHPDSDALLGIRSKRRGENEKRIDDLSSKPGLYDLPILAWFGKERQILDRLKESRVGLISVDYERRAVSEEIAEAIKPQFEEILQKIKT